MGVLDDLTGKLDELKDTVADKAKELKEEAEKKATEWGLLILTTPLNL